MPPPHHDHHHHHHHSPHGSDEEGEHHHKKHGHHHKKHSHHGRGHGRHGHGPGRGRGHHHDHHHRHHSPHHSEDDSSTSSVEKENRVANEEPPEEVEEATEKLSSTNIDDSSALEEPEEEEQEEEGEEEEEEQEEAAATSSSGNKKKTKKRPVKKFSPAKSSAPNPGQCTSTAMFGGTGGADFDDSINRRVVGITVNAGTLVDGITMLYYGGKEVHHGGDGGSKEKIFLRGAEYVDEVTVRANGKRVICLTFKTSKGRTLGPCGGSGGMFGVGKGEEHVITAPGGSMLVGIKGRAGDMLDAIGFHWGPVPRD